MVSALSGTALSALNWDFLPLLTNKFGYSLPYTSLKIWVDEMENEELGNLMTLYVVECKGVKYVWVGGWMKCVGPTFTLQ